MEEGAHVKVKGAVHSVRRMGEITFLIPRRRDGLLQLVCEEGKTKEGYREVREGDTLKAEGTIRKEERSPGGLEIVTEEVTKLSESKKAFPLPVSRKKLNTSLEAKLSVRPLSLRNLRERAKLRFRRGSAGLSGEYLFRTDSRKSIRQKSEQKEQREEPTSSGLTIFTKRRYWSKVPSCTNK